MSDPGPPADDASFSPLRWRDGTLLLLDQTLLQDQEVWLDCRAPEQVAEAIRRLAVRGAPAIGVAAAYGLALGLTPGLSADLVSDHAAGLAADQAAGSPRGEDTTAGLGARFAAVAALLGATRPTPVNPRRAVQRRPRVLQPSPPPAPPAPAPAPL